MTNEITGMADTRLLPRFFPLWILLVLAAANYMHEIVARFAFYRMLHRQYPFYVAESLDKVLGALLCGLVICLMHRGGLRSVVQELGLAAPILPAMAFAFLASVPMLIGFALTRKIAPGLSIPSLLFLTVFSPFIEELEFRGFGFWQLARRARRFPVAAPARFRASVLGDRKWQVCGSKRVRLFLKMLRSTIDRSAQDGRS